MSFCCASDCTTLRQDYKSNDKLVQRPRCTIIKHKSMWIPLPCGYGEGVVPPKKRNYLLLCFIYQEWTTKL